jgi:hypothetical protein
VSGLSSEREYGCSVRTVVVVAVAVDCLQYSSRGACEGAEATASVSLSLLSSRGPLLARSFLD